MAHHQPDLSRTIAELLPRNQKAWGFFMKATLIVGIITAVILVLMFLFLVVV